MSIDEWLLVCQTLILLATGVVVVWYTWETKRVRENSSRQLELQIRPFVILVPEHNEFALENIGHGPAVNVSIRDVLLERGDFKIRIRFSESVPLLRPDERKLVEAESSLNGAPFGDFFSGHIDPQFATQELDVEIEYDNLELRRYSVIQTVSPGEQRISGFLSPSAS